MEFNINFIIPYFVFFKGYNIGFQALYTAHLFV